MTPDLRITDLRFRYGRASEELFNGLCHDFNPGALTALTGPSGRGKSTLLYILGLLLTPSVGGVEINGEMASSLPDSRRAQLRARQLGFVFQDSELDATRPVIDSLVEPALYAGRRRRDALVDARALLERFGLLQRADHTPGQVSGGQAQRLAVCRALINQPAIVLADEPTGNLDRDNAALVLDALTEVAHRQGRTVVIATHDPFVIERSDEVVRL